MKTRLFIKCLRRNKWRLGAFVVAVVIVCALSQTAWPIESHGPGNPIGPGTVPPSSIRSGLTRSPNPIDTSSNLTITGNVGGGKHFRGPVPYRSTNEFGAGLGSSSISSFLRYSTPDDFDRYTAGSKPQPYYLPTETVATTAPGRSGVFTPSAARISDRVPETFGVEDTPQKPVSPPVQGTPIDARLLQTPLSTRQIEKLTSKEAAKNPPSEILTPERYHEIIEQMRRDLQQMSDRVNELKQKQVSVDTSDSLQLPTTVEPTEKMRQLLEKPALAEIPTLPTTQPQESLAPEPADPAQKQLEELLGRGKERAGNSDIYQRVKQQLENLKSSQPEQEAPAVTEKDKDSQQSTAAEKAWEITTGKDKIKTAKSSLDMLRKSQAGADEADSEELSEIERQKSAGTKRSAVDEVEQLSRDQLTAEAKRVMGPHEDVNSLSQAKFTQHILAAQTYLKQGRYYRAADSFALASVYKRDDPGAYAGRAYALFAAGEYVSSALFLSRALEASPQYVQTKVDLAALLGNKSTLNVRIANVEASLERTGTPELRFLLGYIYYRTGNLNRAKQAIDTAYDKMPQSQAVQAVKKAIDDAIASQKNK